MAADTDDCDILIVGYRALDYDQILQHAALTSVLKKQLLGADPKILLLACDFAEPEVDQNQMSALVVDQALYLSSNIRTERARTPESLGEAVEQFLLFHLPSDFEGRGARRSIEYPSQQLSEWDF